MSKRIVLDYGHGIFSDHKRYLFDRGPRHGSAVYEGLLNREAAATVCNILLREDPGVQIYDALTKKDLLADVNRDVPIRWPMSGPVKFTSLEVADVPRKTRIKNANELGGDLFLSIHHNALTKEQQGGGQTTARGSYSYIYNQPERVHALADHLSRPDKIRRDRVITHRAFDVIKYVTAMPAILWEVYFFDNPDDSTLSKYGNRLERVVKLYRDL